MAEIKVEYPCGYKAYMKTNMFEYCDLGDGKSTGCPLHGMKCKKK